MARCAVLRRWLGGATRACVTASDASRRSIVACSERARVAVAVALCDGVAQQRLVPQLPFAAAMRRRCSSASATLHSVEALPLVHDCKQLCDSRTMQRGIDYLQRATPNEQLSTGKVDLTHDGVDFGNVRVLSAALTRAEASRTSLRHRPHGTWVRSTTVARPCGHRQEPWWFCSRRRSVDPAARARARERGPRPSIK